MVQRHCFRNLKQVSQRSTWMAQALLCLVSSCLNIHVSAGYLDAAELSKALRTVYKQYGISRSLKKVEQVLAMRCNS